MKTRGPSSPGAAERGSDWSYKALLNDGMRCLYTHVWGTAVSWSCWHASAILKILEAPPEVRAHWDAAGTIEGGKVTLRL